jgi:hypothetical protein
MTSNETDNLDGRVFDSKEEAILSILCKAQIGLTIPEIQTKAENNYGESMAWETCGKILKKFLSEKFVKTKKIPTKQKITWVINSEYKQQLKEQYGF